MSLLTNIKYQYNSRILKDLLSSNEYSKFFNQLETHKDNSELYSQLLSNFCTSALLKNSEDIFKSKIIWLSSFMNDDTQYVSNFLNYYINKCGENLSKPCQYEDKIISTLKKISNIENLNFVDFVERSYLYQYLILHEDENHVKFLRNHLPFFSTPANLNFTKQTLTNSFIIILDHPYSVYQKIKNQNQDDQNIAKSSFLNLDNQSYFVNIDSTKVEMNKQGWHTHTSSWTDTNVINSLNGKVILKKDLDENTFEILSSIILHFIQSGLKIKMDYKIIEEFIDLNPPNKDTVLINISQKEKKFIDQYINKIMSSYNFKN